MLAHKVNRINLVPDSSLKISDFFPLLDAIHKIGWAIYEGKRRKWQGQEHKSAPLTSNESINLKHHDIGTPVTSHRERYVKAASLLFEDLSKSDVVFQGIENEKLYRVLNADIATANLTPAEVVMEGRRISDYVKTSLDMVAPRTNGIITYQGIVGQFLVRLKKVEQIIKTAKDKDAPNSPHEISKIEDIPNKRHRDWLIYKKEKWRPNSDTETSMAKEIWEKDKKRLDTGEITSLATEATIRNILNKYRLLR